MEDEITKFTDDISLGLAVEGCDEREIDAATLVEGHEQSLLGTPNGRDRRTFSDHVLLQDGGFRGPASGLVVVLQREDEDCVRVLAEFDDIGHAPDRAAAGPLAYRGLVDRA